MYNEMKLNFVFRNWQQLLIVDNYQLGVSTSWPYNLFPNNNSQPQLIADVWAEYALVSNMERVQMGKAPRDMLIEQVQTAPLQQFNAQQLSFASNIMQVFFAHSVKALFFNVQNVTNSSEWSNYTAASPYPTSAGVVFSPSLATDPVANTSLFYENTQRLSNMGSDYFSLIQPWFTAVSIPLETGYHLYSYTLDLLNSNPMGSTNYGKLTNVQLSFTPSADAVVSATTTGTLASPGPLAPQGAGIPQLFQSIIIALNHNIVRIAGGALGEKFSGKPKIGGCRISFGQTLIRLVFGLRKTKAKHLIMPGNPLEFLLLLDFWKQSSKSRVTTSDIVITQKIGQSAGKESTAVKQGHDSPSTTARMLVNNDGLATLSWLKIQSVLWRKSREYSIVPSTIKASYRRRYTNFFNCGIQLKTYELLI
jgi:hypothetical protein